MATKVGDRCFGISSVIDSAWLVEFAARSPGFLRAMLPYTLPISIADQISARQVSLIR